MISAFLSSGEGRSGGLGVAHPQHQKGRKATPCKGPAEAKPEQRVPLGARDLEGGVGAASPHFLSRGGANPLSCPEPKLPKNDANTNEPKRKEQNAQTQNQKRST